jgi:hypothetical protein
MLEGLRSLTCGNAESAWLATVLTPSVLRDVFRRLTVSWQVSRNLSGTVGGDTEASRHTGRGHYRVSTVGSCAVNGSPSCRVARGNRERSRCARCRLPGTGRSPGAARAARPAPASSAWPAPEVRPAQLGLHRGHPRRGTCSPACRGRASVTIQSESRRGVTSREPTLMPAVQNRVMASPSSSGHYGWHG